MVQNVESLPFWQDEGRVYMTYAEAIQFLYGLRLFGAKFGLENTFKLAALAGRPQDRLRFIHVAGTNGKGSTCAMLESIYRTAGLRVGLFTSPHLVSFRERIQVNRQLIPENEVVRLVGEFQPWLRQFPVGHHPTFFEVVTVTALNFFAEQKCDLVVWETGLGGRLDATNIVTPLASVITNIALDHQQWLGDTVEKIAAEKAGIIKPGVPVITAAEDPEALAVIERTARENSAVLIPVAADVKLPQTAKILAALSRAAATLPLPGDHQRINATLALATVEVLQNQIPVGDAAIRTGLETVNWPGRLQLVTRPSGRKILLDGAHNVAGAKALRGALEKNFPVARRTLILGVLQDKDWRHISEILAPLAVRIVTVPVASERTADAQALAAASRAVNSAAGIVACDSLLAALERTAGDEFVVIAGSLYLVGEALEFLGLSPANSGERALNEWTAPAAPTNIAI
jgi:dihydrofolate synthase/folylpolyglutamate synthase